MTNKKHKFAAAVLSGMLALSVFAAVGVTPVGAATVEELTAQINSLLATIAALQAQISTVKSGTTASSGSGYIFTRNLKQGDTGEDVRNLQKALNADGVTVASSGAGSPGNETSSFGPATKAAVIKFQNKYASAVLAPFGLSAGTGFVGSGTRTKLNSLGGVAATSATSATPTTPATTPAVTVPTGSGLTVTAAAVQPAAQLAPKNAARVPFTKVVFTASADGDVKVNSLVVERGGASVDAALDSVVLLDENGLQVGLSKTLNSQHQVTLSQSFTVKAGQSRTMTLAANRGSGDSAHAGMVVALSLVQVNTSATVNGSFPISGTAQTINEGLVIGSATVARGSLDPGTSVTKEVGITGYTFSSIRVTAGSGENLRLRSVRFNQTESANASDLANIMIYVDGTAYTPTVTDNGQYFIASFGNGLLIEKGFSKEISIKGDVIGGSGRKVDFDIAKRTDINIGGELYGYGIMPAFESSSTADDSQVHSADDYYYDGSVLTIDVGSMNISVSNATPAQNIAINTANQPLGSFTVDVKGEAISVGRLAFNMKLGIADVGGDIDDITNITLVDANGTVVAGPVDGSATDSSFTAGSSDGGDGEGGSVVFSDSVTFPVGQHTYFLKGKIGTDIDNNNTITASTTPSNDFATVRGLTTGKTITPAPTSALTMSTMTVKSGAMALSVSSVPIAQTVIAGSKGFEFARYILDATASGEDLRVTTLPLYFDTTGTRTDLTNCQLRDGSATGASLTTGSNTKNPASTDTASSTTFTFDGNGVIVSKGTAKTLSLTCDVRTGVTSDYWWGIDGAISTTASTYTGVTGLVSAQTIVETTTDGNGQRMTASSGGTLTVAIDDASPSYKIVAAGTTGVELARLKFSALNEDVDIRQIALQLSSVASNTPIDLVGQKVNLYDGTSGALVATAGFDTGDTATSSTIAAGAFRVGRNASRVLVVKGDIAAITSSGPLTASGDLLAVDYDGNNVGTNGNYGVGVASGNNVNGSSTDTASAGVRIMRTYPIVEAIALSTAEKTLSAGTTSDKPLYKFKVTTAGGTTGDSVGIYKFTFEVGSSTLAATTSLFSLYAYTDANFSNIDTTFSATGLINAGQCFNGRQSTAAGAVSGSGYQLEIFPDKTGCNQATTTYKIPTGTTGTRYFQLRATVAGVESGTTNIDSFTVRLAGDTAFPVNANTLMQKATGVDGDTNDDFIWSPISTTTSPAIGDLDFTNGYQVTGLPDVGTTQESIQSN